MRETPIIMSGNHPKLILDGIKTMTRRVIKPQPELIPNDVPKEENEKYWWASKVFQTMVRIVPDGWQMGAIASVCPYGQVGDRLWVRETHYRYGHWNKNGFTETGKQKWTFHAINNKTILCYENPPNDIMPNKYRASGWYKRPSIFMPRWASRITLEITDVRVERLRKATLADAIAEGFRTIAELIKAVLHLNHLSEDADPWVWVISFKEV